MYPEFIAIYIGLAVVLVLLIAILILQILILKNGGSGAKTSGSQKRHINSSHGAIVFCKNCAARFNSSERVCPKCGAPRG